ncbi:14603_t:CDS:2, partial [Racocetra fulgida]
NAIDITIHIWYSMIVTGQQWDKCIEIFIKLLHGKLDLQTRKDFLFEFGKLRIYTHFSPKTSDPLSGWDILSVDQVNHGAANDDLYGKLFFYLREQFGMFIDRLQKLTINFNLYDEDALKLCKKFKNKRFDRIYVNNLSDESYIGIKTTLTEFRPLLNVNNPNATLITLFKDWLNSIPESDQGKTMEGVIYKKIDKYKRGWAHNSSLLNANNVMTKISNFIIEASNEVNALYDHAQEFEKYMEKKGANETAKQVGLRRRTIHKIVPKRVGVSMKEDEQNNVLSLEDDRDRHLRFDVGMQTFLERYAEWEIVA